MVEKTDPLFSAVFGGLIFAGKKDDESALRYMGNMPQAVFGFMPAAVEDTGMCAAVRSLFQFRLDKFSW